METFCMKCQILFSGENKKTIVNFSSAEFAYTVVKVYQIYEGESKATSLTYFRLRSTSFFFDVIAL